MKFLVMSDRRDGWSKVVEAASEDEAIEIVEGLLTEDEIARTAPFCAVEAPELDAD